MIDIDKSLKVIAIGGGCDCHPVDEQLRRLGEWCQGRLQLTIADGAEAFDHLDEADLLIASGLHWTAAPTLTWAKPFPYQSPTPAQRSAFERYVGSGRPVLAIHGGIASFDDWPAFGRLLGFGWHWGHSNHSRFDHWQITPVGDHTVVAGIEPFSIKDELYGHVQLSDGVRYTNHLAANLGGLKLPLLITGEGGRVPGAGRCAWFGLGHDLEAWNHPNIRPLLTRSLEWLLGVHS